VTALSVAVVENSQLVFQRTLGLVDVKSGKPAGGETVFRAASLSKPVFAYLVMKMVDEGVIEIDRPLYEYLDRSLYEYPAYSSLRDDPRYELLTAELVLSHQSGFPNRRRIRPDGPISFRFKPGEQFGYSGEGCRLLQFVTEETNGRKLNELAPYCRLCFLGSRHDAAGAHE
jgi:CubicO group peptidase (beta-lactamase class C family)